MKTVVDEYWIRNLSSRPQEQCARFSSYFFSLALCNISAEYLRLAAANFAELWFNSSRKENQLSYQAYAGRAFLYPLYSRVQHLNELFQQISPG
jgi:hypothetical protein